MITQRWEFVLYWLLVMFHYISNSLMFKLEREVKITTEALRWRLQKFRGDIRGRSPAGDKVFSGLLGELLVWKCCSRQLGGGGLTRQKKFTAQQVCVSGCMLGQLQRPRRPPAGLHLRLAKTWTTLRGLFVTLQHYLLPPSDNEEAEKVQSRVQLRELGYFTLGRARTCEKSSSCFVGEGCFHLHKLMKVRPGRNAPLQTRGHFWQHTITRKPGSAIKWIMFLIRSSTAVCISSGDKLSFLVIKNRAMKKMC